METAEQNKSKQVSAKKTALWDVYKYLLLLLLLLLSFFFFLKWNECRETELRKWNKGISGS